MGSQPRAYPQALSCLEIAFPLAWQPRTGSLSGETEDQTSLISDPPCWPPSRALSLGQGGPEIIHVALISVLSPQEAVGCLRLST